MTDFKKSFDRIAENIATKAALETTSFAEVIDAFKAMTALYALQLKHKDAPDDADEGEFSFSNGIHAEDDNGRTKSRLRDRRSS